MNLRNLLDVAAELDFITKRRVTDSACYKTVDKPKFEISASIRLFFRFPVLEPGPPLAPNAMLHTFKLIKEHIYIQRWYEE